MSASVSSGMMPKSNIPTVESGQSVPWNPKTSIWKARGYKAATGLGTAGKVVGKGAVTAGKAAGRGVKKMGKGMAAAAGTAGGFLLGSLRNKGGGSEGEFSPGSVWFFIIISLTAHIFDYIFNAFSPFMRVIVYVALAFFAFMLFQKALPNILRATLLITIGNLLMPTMLQFSIGRSNEIALLVIIFLPMWPLYISLMAKDKVKFIGTLGILWLLFCLILTLNYFLADNQQFLGANINLGDSLKARKTFWDEVKDFVQTSKEDFSSIPEQIRTSWNKSMNYATAGYYQGQEEAVEEPLGVFLNDVLSASENYFENEKVTIWGTLKARNIGKNSMSVKVGCGLSDEWKVESDMYRETTVYPEEFEMEGYDQVDLDCMFENGFPEWGTYDVNLNATFSFETYARLLTYWIDEDSARAITREDEDVPDVYDLPKEPLSYFTSGPVMVGLGLGEQPMKVGQSSIIPTLGLTLESNWFEGKIAKVKSIKILIPEELSLNVEACSDSVFVGGKEDKFNVYYVDVENSKFENIDNYITIRCKFNEVSNNALDPTSPITLRHIKAVVEYDYVVYEEVEIEIEKDVTKQDEEEATTTSNKEEIRECSGTEDSYNYECMSTKECEVAEGVLVDGICTKSNSYCCRTEV